MDLQVLPQVQGVNEGETVLEEDALLHGHVAVDPEAEAHALHVVGGAEPPGLGLALGVEELVVLLEPGDRAHVGEVDPVEVELPGEGGEPGLEGLGQGLAPVLGVELQVLQVAVAQDGLPLEGGLVVVAEEDGHVPFRRLLEGLEAE